MVAGLDPVQIDGTGAGAGAGAGFDNTTAIDQVPQEALDWGQAHSQPQVREASIISDAQL